MAEVSENGELSVNCGSGLLQTLRQFVPEFDPESGLNPGVEDNPGIYKAWKTYYKTFSDACDVERIVDSEMRRKLLLLLGGYKFREKVEELIEDFEGVGVLPDYERTVQLLNDHFFNLKNVTLARYRFFYNSFDKDDELTTDLWLERLRRLGAECHFERGMSLEEAMLLVLCKYTPYDKLRSEILSSVAVTPEQAFTYARQLDSCFSDSMYVKTEPELITESKETSSSSAVAAAAAAAAQFIYTNNGKPRLVAEDDESLDNHNGKCKCPNCQRCEGKPSRHNCHVAGCGKEYTKVSHLRAHLMSHKAVLPFACKYCGKRFYRSDQLTRHERTHTGEKKFVCSKCNRGFTRSDHLTKHARTHNNN